MPDHLHSLGDLGQPESEPEKSLLGSGQRAILELVEMPEHILEPRSHGIIEELQVLEAFAASKLVSLVLCLEITPLLEEHLERLEAGRQRRTDASFNR